MIARSLQVCAALAVGGALIWLLGLARTDAERSAAAWAEVTVRTAVALEDTAPGALVLQPVALAAPNDHAGLAVYSVQEEHCRTEIYTTRKDDGTTQIRTRQVCNWDTIRERWLNPIPVVTEAEGAPLDVRGGIVGGPMRYISLGYVAGSPRRAVGWAQGDGLLIVGRMSAEPPAIDAAYIIAGTSPDAWKRQESGKGYVWLFLQIAAIAAAVVGAGAAWMGVFDDAF